MNKDIKPIWADYREWEDYKNNMYENGNSVEIIRECKKILTSDDLKENMTNTTIKYPISTKVNFTNKMFNPISWLGQATCNQMINAKAQEVCRAWMMMSKDEQIWANNIAKEVIGEWRNNYEGVQQ